MKRNRNGLKLFETDTGNPFVDTALAVIGALAGLNDIRQLTLGDLKRVFGDGSKLAKWNSRLKSFTLIFGTNGPLYQHSYGMKKGRGPSVTNKRIYIDTLIGFLASIGREGDGVRCSACGGNAEFDFSGICRKAAEKNGMKTGNNKQIGRDWFPLAGSLGSNAQALPSASRAVSICPRCLFAVHYLPLVTLKYGNQLVVFQSFATQFWYDLVRTIVDTMIGRVNHGNYDTLGKEDHRTIIFRLLDFFEDLQRRKIQGTLQKEAALYVWFFKNVGDDPSAGHEIIPNGALTFLWEATREVSRDHVEALVKSDGNKPRQSLLPCILEKRDYPPLYPQGNWTGAPIKLFNLYQTRVRGYPVGVLQTAAKITLKTAESLSEKELNSLKKLSPYKTQEMKGTLRNVMLRMAETDNFSIEEYLSLFPADGKQGVSVRHDGERFVHFYLQHADELRKDPAGRLMGAGYEATPLPVISGSLLYYAAEIYNHCAKKKGLATLKKEIVSRPETINGAWLQTQFLQIAEAEPGFTFGDWHGLSTLEDGRFAVSELLFQMKLLWIRWINENANGVHVPAFESPTSATGLPIQVEEATQAWMTRYVSQRGVERFRRDVLARLERKEIGLHWLGHTLTELTPDNPNPLSDTEWNNFMLGDSDQIAVTDQGFRLRLAIANLLRKNGQS